VKNQLILNVAALDEASQPLEVDLSREFLDTALRAEPPTEFHAAGAAKLRGRVTKMGRKVLVQAKATAPIQGQCKRCLKPVSLEEPLELVRTWVPADQAHAGERREKKRGEETEASFDPETVDEEAYAGKELDLSSALREQILLSVPASPLCREDCQGLCPTCGKDLNEGECGCDRAVVDPRWAALKGIQLKPDSKKEK